jgi:hypothetical protein
MVVSPRIRCAPGREQLRSINFDYVFQFCPIVGASARIRNNGKRFHIISDALWDYPGLREVNPHGEHALAWQPLPGYADPDQANMASNPAPDKNGDGKPTAGRGRGTIHARQVRVAVPSQDVLSSTWRCSGPWMTGSIWNSRTIPSR